MRTEWLVWCLVGASAAATVQGIAVEAESTVLPTHVVSATKIATDPEKIASSVTLLTASDLARMQVRTVLDALKGIEGVHVTQNGGLGQPATVFLRGANSEHVLVIIDGVQVNDPSTPGRVVDLTLLDVSDVESIEILRGPQSALYGSDAIAGVINIVTRKGKGKPSVTLSAEGGSYDTFRETAEVRGGTEHTSYAVSLSRVDSGGFSAADETDGNTEDDGYEKTTVSARFGFDPTENAGVSVFARHMDQESEYDDGVGPGADARDNVSEYEAVLVGANGRLDLLDSRWNQKLSASYATHDRSFDDSWGYAEYDANQFQTEWQHDFLIHDSSTLTVGTEYEREEAKGTGFSEVSADTLSVYAQDILTVGALTTVVGARYDDHEQFGDEVTYRVAPMITIEATGTRLVATYGTGFKSPSLYQLYAPTSAWGPIGNSDLVPEESDSWDAGFDQKLAGERATVGARYFETDIENLIDFVNGYENVAEAATRGVEVTAKAEVTEDLSVGVAYTYTDTEDLATGERLVRRPLHQASFNANYAWGDRANLGMHILYVGERDDRYYDGTSFSFVRTVLDDYTIVNVAASWQATRRLNVFARIENLFDEDYQQTAGYGTAGISGYGGVKVTL